MLNKGSITVFMSNKENENAAIQTLNPHQFTTGAVDQTAYSYRLPYLRALNSFPPSLSIELQVKQAPVIDSYCNRIIDYNSQLVSMLAQSSLFFLEYFKPGLTVTEKTVLPNPGSFELGRKSFVMSHLHNYDDFRRCFFELVHFAQILLGCHDDEQ